jgi:CTP synthase (UTP-ammonia lyase)
MTVRIGIAGDLTPAYPSHREIEAARGLLGDDVETSWVASDGPGAAEIVAGATAYDGLWIAPGSPYADDAAVLEVIRCARERAMPLLGTCGGLQYAVLEFARNVLGGPGTHAEIDGVDDSNAVAPLACSLVGQERLVTPTPGTWFADLVAGEAFVGMHYCGYGPTQKTVTDLTENDWQVEASAPDAPAEVLRLKTHPFFVLSLFQPQIGAIKHGRVHPLLHAFVDAAHRGANSEQSHAMDG